MNLDNVTIVDVRTPVEFAQQHYPGAINIPLDEVPQRINEFKDFKMPVVVYCRSGIRSGMAVGALKQSGILEVINGGGLDDMLHAKLNYNV
jgi:phage shock protein E